jgi:hypothetical protein
MNTTGFITMNSYPLSSDTTLNSGIGKIFFNSSLNNPSNPGAQRWMIGNSDVETGNNSGFDFAIYSYQDNGQYLGNPLRIKRTGLTSISNLSGDIGSFNNLNSQTINVNPTGFQINNITLTSISTVGITGLSIIGNSAYVLASTGPTGYFLVDISSPNNLTGIPLSTNNLTGMFDSVIQGKYMYTINSTNLVVSDISNPSNPIIVSTGYITSNSNYKKLTVNNQYAYVINDTGILWVMNIAINSSPTGAIFFTGPTGATGYNSYTGARVSTSITDTFDMMIYENILFISSNSSSLKLYDVSNIRNIVNISIGSNYTPSASYKGLYVSNNYLYSLLSVPNTLQIIDISNPFNLTNVNSNNKLTSLSLSFNPAYITVAGKYAYISNSNNNSITIVNVNNPKNPSIIQNISLSFSPNKLALIGKNLYSISNTGLNSIDLGGIDVNGANIASAKIGQLQVTENSNLIGNVNCSNSMVVGGDLNVQGNFNASWSSNLLLSTASMILRVTPNISANIVSLTFDRILMNKNPNIMNYTLGSTLINIYMPGIYRLTAMIPITTNNSNTSILSKILINGDLAAGCPGPVIWASNTYLGFGIPFNCLFVITSSTDTVRVQLEASGGATITTDNTNQNSFIMIEKLN